MILLYAWLFLLANFITTKHVSDKCVKKWDGNKFFKILNEFMGNSFLESGSQISLGKPVSENQLFDLMLEMLIN